MSSTDYYDLLREVLEVPPIAEEATGASRMVFCLARPSFHPECSITFIERGNATELVVRAASRSVWSFYQAQLGNPWGDHARDWVKPAVSTERIAVTKDLTDMWQTIVEIENAPASVPT